VKMLGPRLRSLLAPILVASAGLMTGVACAGAGNAAGDLRRPVVPRLDHVVVVVFENEERRAVLGSGAAPTFDRLAASYAQATNDHAVSHPSLPNYLALVSGSTHGVIDDCVNCPQTGPTIGDLLSRRGLSWDGYAEGFPSGVRFAKKHVPFLYFAASASHVLPLSAFDPKHLPVYAFVTPDLCHDMHDCPIHAGDAWLARFIKPLLLVKNTVIFVVFDEGSTSIGGGGHVPLLALGSAVKPHSRYTAWTSHYGLLRTIEEALGLRRIGASARAEPITGIWR
jgi:hypothetical protein